MTAMTAKTRKDIAQHRAPSASADARHHAWCKLRAKGLTLFAICAFVCAFPETQTAARAQQPGGPLSAPTRPGAASGDALPSPTRPALPAVTSTGKRRVNPDNGSNDGNQDAPARTSTWTSARTSTRTQSAATGKPITIDGLAYINLVNFARELGYSASWKKTGDKKTSEILMLDKGSRHLEFTAESREFFAGGIRVFAGSAIRASRGALWISRIDATNLLEPIVAPANGRRSVVPLKIIAIDAGHGGIDKGKINERLKIFEKDMVLDTAKRLKTLLEKQGFKVVMTRTTDKKIELTDRPEIAAKAGADLFVSLHFNSVESSSQSVSGIEVYRFTPRYQAPVSRTSVSIEDKIANPGDANGFWNSVVAYDIHRALLAGLKAPDRGFKHHKFAVLRLTKCPAVLVEAGFLSNDAEARKINTPAYRQKIAEAIAAGIKDYAADVATALR
jgi:N-acetylmuramoyl-L-alanine amidase